MPRPKNPNRKEGIGIGLRLSVINKLRAVETLYPDKSRSELLEPLIEAWLDKELDRPDLEERLEELGIVE